nr:zinc finger, CCHC-type [Tanacetum cinerariifolium]
MHFLLTTLKMVYVLTTPMPELVEDATVEAIRTRAMWENDDYMCRGHILNGMSDSLFDVYMNVESAKELLVMEQYNELLRILGQYTQHDLKMDESISVLSIIDNHLRIEKSLRADSEKGKGKEVGGPSVNMTEEGKNKHNKQNKGKKRSNENDSGFSSNKKPKLECWKCGKTGHFKRDCHSGKKNKCNCWWFGKKGLRTNLKTNVDAIAWWIDYGATTHVCKDRCWFKTFKPVEDGPILYMGDEHFTPVHGKGSVALEFSSRKIVTLFNVLYVPKLRKNLVSGPVLNKCGYKQVYEFDKYILSKSGVFVGFGYYNNGMFMLNLNKVPDDLDSVYMSSSTVVNSSLWHAHLGHVHYKRMLEISKDDLILAIDKNLKKCTTSPYTLQQNGVAERKNRALKKMLYLVEGSRDQVGSQYSYYFSIEEDPRTYSEAMQSRDAAFWKKAIDDEIGSIIENNTWVLSDLPPGCKWIFKWKMKFNGTIDKFKARLPEEKITENSDVPKKDAKAATPADDAQSRIQAARERFLARKGNK